MSDVLLATDADWIFDEVDAALTDDATTVHRVRRGVDVVSACVDLEPGLVVIDMQIGNMGGMASCMALRHEQSAGRLPVTKILLLLDRSADVFLAHKASADGWLLKPLDPFRLRRASLALRDNSGWFEGLDEAS